MADLLSDPYFYIILIILIILSVVTYFEIKFLRRRRLERVEAKIKVDDVYNQIVTARAVSKAMKGQGKNTKAADLMILEADTAFSRGSYSEAKAAVEQAKSYLRDAKIENPPQSEPMAKQQEVKPQEPKIVPLHETKKLPKNYLESKFMISSVWDQIETASRDGIDTTAARDNLRAAEAAFAQEDYSEALKNALKSKKILESGVTDMGDGPKPTEVASIEKVPSALVVPANMSKCEKCSMELDPGDMFCSKCGAKVARDIRCPRCANKVKVDDAYCRNCGLPLRND
jgi:hypothetical protein